MGPQRLFLQSCLYRPFSRVNSYKIQYACVFQANNFYSYSSARADSLGILSSILKTAAGEGANQKSQSKDDKATSRKDTASQDPNSPPNSSTTQIREISGIEERTLPLLDSNTISSDGKMSPNIGILLNQDGLFKNVTWQMHIYAHRHNVHITVARPPAWRHPVTGKVYGENPPSRSIALSLSAGRLGFKHSGRKSYDSAFQLGTYVMARMQESGMNSYIEKLEVYLRGYGAGREAVTRVLLGVEGKYLRNKIVKVADSTRLKIGGTRGANPRRLG